MTHLRLRIYTNPGSLEIFMLIPQRDGNDKRLTAIIHTGAQISLLPQALMDVLEYRTLGVGSLFLEQAGIPSLGFEATEAIVRLALEDELGVQTAKFEAPVWFAGTNYVLLRFQGVLDRAVLHLDMPNLSGYLDITL